MSHGFKRVWGAFGDASRAMWNQEYPRDAAAISYFVLVALFPSILVLIAVVDAFLGWLHLHNRVVQRVIALFPGSRQFLAGNLAEITAPSAAVVLSCIVVVIWCSTWVFTFIETAMNRAWMVTRRRTFLERRIRSITLMLLGGVLLLMSAGITALVSSVRSRANTARIPDFAKHHILNWLWSLILLGAGFVIAILVFGFVFKLIPDRKVPWNEAFSGAVVSAFCWEIGSYIFVKLVPYFDYQRVYGRTGAIIALLTWVYTSSLILLFGANFSARLHNPDLDSRAAGSNNPTPGREEPGKVRFFPGSR